MNFAVAATRCSSCRSLDARRPCLEYHIKRCLAPCAGKVDAETYKGMIQEVCLLLEGRSDAVMKSIRQRMEIAAEELEFEKAAKLRDQLVAVEKLREKQTPGSDEIIITHQQIANELGTAREVVSRLLKQLELSGKVEILRGKIKILSPL